MRENKFSIEGVIVKALVAAFLGAVIVNVRFGVPESLALIAITAIPVSWVRVMEDLQRTTVIFSCSIEDVSVTYRSLFRLYRQSVMTLARHYGMLVVIKQAARLCGTGIGFLLGKP